MRDDLRLKLKQPQIFLTVFTMVALIPLVYQNCSEPPLESYDLKSVAATAPFAFEEKIDQIAYMSCSDLGVPTSYDRNAFFTFKAGMYNAGSGFRITPAYFNATRNLSFADKVAALEQSPENSKVFMAMALRERNNLQSPVAVNNHWAAMFIGSLSSSGVASPLVKNSGQSFLKDFSGVTTTNNISDTIHLNHNTPTADDVRNGLASGSDILAITYNKIGASAGQALAPSKGSATNVYGHGYKVTFKSGTDQSNGVANGMARVLANIEETNLATGAKVAANWQCMDKGFIIVRSTTDLGQHVICDKYTPGVDPTPTNAAETQILALLRSMLSKEDWDIDLKNRCIIPKKVGLCYGNGANLVNYKGAGNTFCPNATSCKPPEYLSICKRT